MRILIADDDPISRRLLKGTLERQGHEVVSVDDGTRAVEALTEDGGPQLAILDWTMPGLDGLAVCRAVRERAGSYVYMILLTGRDGLDDMVEAMDAGADDFLSKPLNATELRARLRSGIRVIELQDRLLKAQEALRLEAARDYLTGLWNRGMITEQLRRELKRALHERRPLAIILADIDHFKSVNDNYGHPVGDVVLREVADRLRRAVRDYDFSGRYGGEEFLIVLPGCDGRLVAQVAERIRKRISQEPIRVDTMALPVTVSLGYAWTTGLDRTEPLIVAADVSLYRAKAAGRDRACGGDEPVTAAATPVIPPTPGS